MSLMDFLLRVPAQECRSGQRRYTQQAEQSPGITALFGRPRGGFAYVLRRDEDPAHGAENLDQQCRKGDAVQIGEYLVIVVTHCTESRAAQRLNRPTQPDY